MSSKSKSTNKKRKNKGNGKAEVTDPSDGPLYPVYEVDGKNLFSSRNAELEVFKKHAQCHNANHNTARSSPSNALSLCPGGRS